MSAAAARRHGRCSKRPRKRFERDVQLFKQTKRPGANAGPRFLTYKPESLEEIERRHILETLKHTDWNKSQAATILGIERSTLDRKIKGFGLTK